MKEEDPWAGGLDSLNALYTWLPLARGEEKGSRMAWGGW